jgi:hypothetical protein
MGDEIVTREIPGLLDAYGQPAIARAQRGYHGYGTNPFGICRETRQKIKGYSAEWLPTANMARFISYRDAVKFIKAHEAIAYGTDA